jgi:hypothetical protein
MKHCVIIILLLFCKNCVFAADRAAAAFFFHQTIGYQVGYSSSQTSLMQEFDYNGTFLLVVNYGYNYQPYVGSKIFIGVGCTELIQMQYGYAFGSNNHILRLRSDWSLCFLWDTKYLRLSTIGVFAEKQFGYSSTSGYSFGISLGISVWDIISNYERYKDKK